MAALLGSIWLAATAAAQALEPWGQAQGGPTHTGYVAEAPAPPYQEAWRFGATPGGPGGAFGLSAPVIAGSTVVAVGPRVVVAADLDSGEPLWSVDRTYGPPVSPAVASTPDGRVLLYTQGFGDSPPGTSPTPSGEASAVTGSLAHGAVRLEPHGDRSGDPGTDLGSSRCSSRR